MANITKQNLYFAGQYDAGKITFEEFEKWKNCKNKGRRLYLESLKNRPVDTDRPEPKTKRNRLLSIRLSDSEMLQLQDVYQEHHSDSRKSRGELCRELLLNGEVYKPTEEEKAGFRALSKIGNNLNQIAKYVNVRSKNGTSDAIILGEIERALISINRWTDETTTILRGKK